MDIQNIDKHLSTVDSTLDWAAKTANIPASEKLSYRKKLISIRRELKKIRYAASERCSTAAFGESQMGKSYLVSAMLSTPSQPFSVTNDGIKYDFINEINPSRPNSTIEATGVITRFTTTQDQSIPKGFLKVQLLSVTDIILILCEAYYNQVDYSRDSILSSETINANLYNIVPEKPSSPISYFSVDDIFDIKDYLDHSSMLKKKCNDILRSNFFDYLAENLDALSENQFTQCVQLLWNSDEHIGRLWKDMLSTYRDIKFEKRVFARFDSVLKKKGTLLDVARLDEMYGEPEDSGSEYEEFAEVKLPTNISIKTKKSFFSSLIAELSFTLDEKLKDSHPFLNELDILDFPGARRPEQIKQEKLGEGKNLSTVLRRGKVTYLFNKYSEAKRISTLLFCHNNSMSGESSMGGLLDKWVNLIVGDSEKSREDYVNKSSLPPLFIIGTWFNKDVEYQDESQNDIDSLEARWKRRFSTVLEKEVLKSLGDDKHWLNSWSTSTKQFQNIYMLRDFKYSKMIYKGYDPLNNHPETGGPVRPERYPNYFEDLKKSFIENDFVKAHFSSPVDSWNDAATCAMDGTKRIIANLNIIAPNVSNAREAKFSADILKIEKDLHSLLFQYYHPESSDEKLKLAKRQAGTACLHIDKMMGRDSYSFGRFVDSMIMSESEVYELVHSHILGGERPMPMSDEESQIFMAAGLDSSATREANIERLCDYLGVDDEEECKNALEGIDLDKLLSQNQMMAGKAELLVSAVEDMWHNKVLMDRVIQSSEDILPSVSTIMSSMWSFYIKTNCRDILINKIRDYINKLDSEVSVGVISDYLSMQFNEFVNTFGYAFIKAEEMEELLKKNKEMKLNIDESILTNQDTDSGMELFSDLYKQKDVLEQSSFKAKDRAFLARFPQYSRIWKWEQQMRIGFILVSEIPNYNVKDNDVIKHIIDNDKI